MQKTIACLCDMFPSTLSRPCRVSINKYILYLLYLYIFNNTAQVYVHMFNKGSEPVNI